MKKLSCTLILFWSLYVHSQNPVPNPGFETWIDYGPYEDPDSWNSFNESTWPFGGVTAKKDSGTHSGALAVKLITIGHNNTIIPGVLCTGSLSFADASCSGGFPVNIPYANFTGFYKYLPVSGDSSVMFAMLTKWNTISGARDTIADATLLGELEDNYTYFSIPFNYHSAETPDSGQIVLSSTKYLFNATPGSFLIVDDLAFSGVVGIDEISPVAAKIFPDPADELLQLQVSSVLHVKSIDVIDCFGRMMQSNYLLNSPGIISTKQFPGGIFFYKMLDENRRVVASGKFVVHH